MKTRSQDYSKKGRTGDLQADCQIYEAKDEEGGKERDKETVAELKRAAVLTVRVLQGT